MTSIYKKKVPPADRASFSNLEYFRRTRVDRKEAERERESSSVLLGIKRDNRASCCLISRRIMYVRTYVCTHVRTYVLKKRPQNLNLKVLKEGRAVSSLVSENGMSGSQPASLSSLSTL